MTTVIAPVAGSSEPGRRSTSLVDAHGLLCEMESRLDLLRHRVDGWAAWPLLRFEVSVLLAGVSYPEALTLGRAARIGRALADVPALLTVSRARHLIKTYSSGLAEKVGDRYWDIWFDDIVAVGGSTFKIEVPTNLRFARRSAQAQTSRNISSCFLDACSGVLARRRPARDVVEVAARLSQALRDGLGLTDLDTGWVLARLQHFVASKRVYRALVRRVRPAYVLVVECTEYALIAAARELGSCAIEVQHGVSDRTHAGYGWTEYAVPYRATMPLPDRLLLHGEHWKRELDAGGFWGDSLRVVGSPRIDRFRQMARARPQEGPVLLFTTQGLDTARVTAFLREFLELAEARVPVRLMIKLHPQHDSNPSVYLDAFSAFRDRVTVVAGDEDPSTFELLCRAHVHLSIASATHYDAIGLGVPTVILPFQTYEVALPLLRAGHAHIARTPEELADLVAGWRSLRVPDGVSEYYFKSGAVPSTLEELGLPRARPPLN